MEKYKVSVVMPAYNAEKYIEESINSVINQTYDNIELIIVNDCSKDKTSEIINKYAQDCNKIKIVNNETNQGVSKSRNIAMELATGEYIAFLDSDDIWEKDKIQKQMNFMNENNAEFTYTGIQYINQDGTKYDYVMQVPKMVSYKELLKQNVIACSSVIISKKMIGNIKMKNDNVHEDFVFWLNILKNNNRAYGINEPLLKYRITTNSKSGNKLKSIKMTYNVYKYMNLKFYERIYYMIFYLYRNAKKYRKILITSR